MVLEFDLSIHGDVDYFNAWTMQTLPREAPVTIAILSVPCSISSLLIIFRGQSASDEREMSLSPLRIIRHPPASQSENHEQTIGPVRRDAGVHAGSGMPRPRSAAPIGHEFGRSPITAG